MGCDCAPHHSLGRRAHWPAAPLAYGAGGRRAPCAPSWPTGAVSLGTPRPCRRWRTRLESGCFSESRIPKGVEPMEPKPEGYSGKPPCLPVRKGERALPGLSTCGWAFFRGLPRGFGMPGITFAPAAPDALWARRLADPPSELSEMEPAPAPDRPIGGLHDVSSTFPWFGLSSPPRLRGGGPYPVSYTHLRAH